MPENKNTLHHLTIDFKYDKNYSILNKSTDARTYHNAILLTPGEFSDSVTKAPVVYKSEEIEKSQGKWESNYLNLDHSIDTLNRIGYVVNPRYINNCLMGDLKIYPITENARDTIALIEEGMINKLSIEMMTEDEWDPRECKRFATNLRFLGVAICTFPADIHTRIK